MSLPPGFDVSDLPGFAAPPAQPVLQPPNQQHQQQQQFPPHHRPHHQQMRPEPFGRDGYDNGPRDFRPPSHHHQNRFQPQQHHHHHHHQHGGHGHHMSHHLSHHHHHHHQPQMMNRPPMQPPPNRDREATNTVWLGNLDPQHTDEWLRSEFERYGQILRISHLHDKNVAFIHYEHVNEARDAVDEVTRVQALGPHVRVGYGKLFHYTPQEVERALRQSRGGGPSVNPLQAEPTPVLWVSDLTPEISEADLRRAYEGFGEITHISSVESKGIAFVHFTSIEAVTEALRVMKDVPVRGIRVRINYGRAQNNSNAATNRADEAATNVVWLGGLPPNVSQGEVDEMFAPFDGFIDAKVMQDKGIGFGHFVEIPQAVKARDALQGKVLNGTQIRVGFGKNNHTKTVIGSTSGNAPGSLDHFLQKPAGDAGALVAVPGLGIEGALTLPSETLGGRQAVGETIPAYMTAKRGQIITVENRLSALVSSSYYHCQLPAPLLSAQTVCAICAAVDDVRDHDTADLVRSRIAPSKEICWEESRATIPHALAVIAKRLKAEYDDDPHKRLYVLYSVTRAIHDNKAHARVALDMFVVLVAVVAQGILDSEAMQHIHQVGESCRQFLNSDDEKDKALGDQLSSCLQKSKSQVDAANLLKRFKKKD